jgi:hypothetical protein
MKTFMNGISKQAFRTEMLAHQEADAFLQGIYGIINGVGDVFRGCTIGCGIESINRLTGETFAHGSSDDLAEALGWPVWLADLSEAIFEGLSYEDAIHWSLRLVDAIPENVDVDVVRNQFISCVTKDHAELCGEDIEPYVLVSRIAMSADDVDFAENYCLEISSILIDLLEKVE